MRTLTRAIICAAALLASAAASSASYPEGYAADGYVYRGGYWWSGNSAYARSLYQPPGYYSYGRYYYPPAYYVYTYSHAYTPPAAPAYPPRDWKAQLLDLAAQRDKTEGAIRRGAFEQAYFLDAVKALGLQGNFAWQGYGAAPPYGATVPYGAQNPHYYPSAGHSNLQYSYAGPQSSTLYGYSYNTIASFYGDANLSTLYQQAARLAEQAQGLSGQATAEFGQLIAREGDNRARVAEILAKGQAVAEYMKALGGSGGKVEIKGTAFKLGPGEKPIAPMPPPANGNGGEPEKAKTPDDGPAAPADVQAVRKAWEHSASTKCFGCHGANGRKDGKFDVQTFPSLSRPVRLSIVTGRLLTADEGKRMPRAEGGKAAAPLAPAEVALWMMVGN